MAPLSPFQVIIPSFAKSLRYRCKVEYPITTLLLVLLWSSFTEKWFPLKSVSIIFKTSCCLGPSSSRLLYKVTSARGRIASRSCISASNLSLTFLLYAWLIRAWAFIKLNSFFEVPSCPRFVIWEIKSEFF